MACYRPLTAYRSPGGGKLTFGEGRDAGQAVSLPCGRCIGCRIKRTQDWAVRCMHEAHMHQENCFITLTYSDEHYTPNLDYADLDNFWRRLRKAGRKFRYFAAGEYGDLDKRPHWHALIFGYAFSEWKQIGKELWRSKELEDAWPYGYSSLGNLTWQSAAYVASYCTKKVTGEAAEKHYTRVHLATGEILKVNPEQARMSLKPAIGKTFFDKYCHEIYVARDAVVKQGGKTTRPPRYYDKLLTAANRTLMCERETERIQQAILREKDNTPERLLVREQVAIAKQKQKQRKL